MMKVNEMDREKEETYQGDAWSDSAAQHARAQWIFWKHLLL